MSLSFSTVTIDDGEFHEVVSAAVASSVQFGLLSSFEYDLIPQVSSSPLGTQPTDWAMQPLTAFTGSVYVQFPPDWLPAVVQVAVYNAQ
jgi:hypothetical protein